MFRPFRGNELNGMIAALGVSIILQNGAALIFGTSPLFAPDFVSGSVTIGPATVSAGCLVAIGLALVTLAGFTVFLRFTKTGRAMRAVVQDTEIATIQGIRPGAIYPIGFALAPIALGGPFLSHLGVVAALTAIPVIGLAIISRVGQLSLCHAAFIGIGAYGSAIITKTYGAPVLVGIVGGCAIAAILAAVLGYFVLKTRGVYFVLITFTFGQVLGLLFLDLEGITGGAGGIPSLAAPSLFGVEMDNAIRFYPLALAALLLVVVFTHRLLGSSIGRAFGSIASNMQLAESSGIPTLAYQNLAFAVGSVLAALSGALMAHYIRFVSPTSYEYDLTVTLIVMMVLGGRGSIVGAVIGAVFVTLLSETLRDTQQLQNILYGAAILLVLRFAPDGVVSIPRRFFSGARLAPRSA